MRLYFILFVAILSLGCKPPNYYVMHKSNFRELHFLKLALGRDSILVTENIIEKSKYKNFIQFYSERKTDSLDNNPYILANKLTLSSVDPTGEFGEYAIVSLNSINYLDPKRLTFACLYFFPPNPNSRKPDECFLLSTFDNLISPPIVFLNDLDKRHPVSRGYYFIGQYPDSGDYFVRVFFRNQKEEMYVLEGKFDSVVNGNIQFDRIKYYELAKKKTKISEMYKDQYYKYLYGKQNNSELNYNYLFRHPSEMENSVAFQLVLIDIKKEILENDFDSFVDNNELDMNPDEKEMELIRFYRIHDRANPNIQINKNTFLLDSLKPKYNKLAVKARKEQNAIKEKEARMLEDETRRLEKKKEEERKEKIETARKGN
jgi:hypothetical protein